MRPTHTLGAVVATVLIAAFAASPARADGVPGFAAKPGTILERFGLTMSEQEAMERIAFHPFVPSPNYTEVALVPPFHGNDKDNPENRGIGYEYVAAGISYVLREWPRAGGSLVNYPAYAGPKSCPESHYVLGTPRYPRAVAWQTPALIFTLQPDIAYGTNPNLAALHSEWARLAQRGACR